MKIIVRKSGYIPNLTSEDLKRLRDAMKQPIDYSEIPKQKGPFKRLKRDANGNLPKRKKT